MDALSPIRVGREGALSTMERLSALTHIVSSAEYLSRPEATEAGSLGDWEINRERFAFLGKQSRRLLDGVARSRVSRALHVSRIMAGLTLLAPTTGSIRACSSAILAVSSAVLYPRHHLGTDGSDQVAFQTSTASFVARLTPYSDVRDAALWYVALQSTLSYFVSGTVKTFGPSWRNGTAVAGVMRTLTYGSRPIWERIKDHPRIAYAAAHSMLIGEAAFFLSFAWRGRPSKLLIASATVFHAGIGASMGLGRFVTAFGSMLPAVAFVSNDVPKSKAFPRTAACGAIVIAIVGLVSSFDVKRRVTRLGRNESRLRLQCGGVIAVVERGAVHAPTATVLLDHGMLSTPEHFTWLAEDLSRSCHVVTFARRGYGASRHARSHRHAALEPAELKALIDRFAANSGRVFVGGHSLGGYLAHLAAEQRDQAVAGVIYLDATHPGQLERSPRQREGAAHLDAAFVGITTSLRLGLGWLLSQPSWIGSLPTAVQGTVLDQYRDSRLWAAGLREWRLSKSHFANPSNQSLAQLNCPALVISAETSVRSDPVQNELNADIAANHMRACEVSVRRATHDSLLTSSDHARAAAAVIREFIECEVALR